jgi:hypothetical protein
LKVNREVIRRLEVAEKKLKSTEQTKYVVLDFDGRFFGECGFDLSQEQFDAWVKQKGMEVEVLIIKYAIDGEGDALRTAVLKLADAKKEPELLEKSN